MASRQVSRYETLDWLGDGRFANVYLARETLPPYNQVAIKVMKEELLDDSRAKAAFTKEKDILERLRDVPSVVRLMGERYSFSGAQRIPYLVLSIPPGKDLIDLIDERGPFSEQEGLQICLQVCDVLCHAHALGIVHNDIKPEHFFWDGRIASVIDWNVSRFVIPGPASRQEPSSEKEDHSPSREQPRRGIWAAIRQVFGGKGAGETDPGRLYAPVQASPSREGREFLGDILEFGTVMYAIFTGWDARDRPQDESLVDISARSNIDRAQTVGARLDREFIVTGEGITWPVYFGEYKERLSTELQDVISKALHPGESSRFQSMRELRTALEHCAPELVGEALLTDDLPGLRQPEPPFMAPVPARPPDLPPRDADGFSRKVRAHIAKGKSALQAEDYQDAILEFRQALALDPQNEVAARLLSQAERMLGSDFGPGAPGITPERQVRSLISKGRSAMNAGDFDDAIAFFEQALDLAPDNEQAQRLLTQARIKRKEQGYQPSVAMQDPGYRYYDANTKGWLPQGYSAQQFNVPYVLEIVKGPQVGVWYPVPTDARLTLGRAYRSDFVLTHWSVSRSHAVLICRAGHCQVVDSNSMNGTFVNGYRVVDRQEIRPGDLLQLGQATVLRLNSTMAVPPTQIIHR